MKEEHDEGEGGVLSAGFGGGGGGFSLAFSRHFSRSFRSSEVERQGQALTHANWSQRLASIRVLGHADT